MSKVKEDNVDGYYDNYLENKKNIDIWKYANKVLYEMCSKSPKHEEKSVIAGKLLIIGRTYSAAFERRKTNDGRDTECFYTEAIQLEKWKNVDRWLRLCDKAKLKGRKELLKEVILTHKKLVNLMSKSMKVNENDDGGMDKTSLASKYLHFHRPDYFYIYDSRAKSAVGKCLEGRITEEDKCYGDIKEYDNEYALFVSKVEKVNCYLEEKREKEKLSPREMDNFLLYAVHEPDENNSRK